ncbi:MAG: helix-hairpin-helix domain-containing protein [Clostridia bacterium]|nr:helix-hairpin-helix domain-containing protein [Clostridia bacterium]
MPDKDKREEERGAAPDAPKTKRRLTLAEIMAFALAAVFIAAAVFLAVRRFSSGDLVFKPTSSTAKTVETEWVVNINTASAEELMMLDGIGEALAERIIDYRDEHGGFESVWDVVNVSGISRNMFNKIYEHITV